LPFYLPLQGHNLGIKINNMLPLHCKTRGVVQFKEVTPGSNQKGTPIKEGTPGSSTSSLKTQAQGRKDTPGRSKVSSSFKTQQTEQGRILKADSKVHSNLTTRPNTN
jgi:hypothetical protein